MQKGIIGKKIGMTQIFDEQESNSCNSLLKLVLALSFRRRQLRMTAMRLFSLATATSERRE